MSCALLYWQGWNMGNQIRSGLRVLRLWVFFYVTEGLLLPHSRIPSPSHKLPLWHMHSNTSG